MSYAIAFNVEIHAVMDRLKEKFHTRIFPHMLHIFATIGHYCRLIDIIMDMQTVRTVIYIKFNTAFSSKIRPIAALYTVDVNTDIYDPMVMLLVI
mgnify:CR=1 FL=1